MDKGAPMGQPSRNPWGSPPHSGKGPFTYSESEPERESDVANRLISK